jgi:hypothetical protein
MKKSSLVSVRQIIRQILAKASVVRQPKKVYCEMIGIGAKSKAEITAIGIHQANHMAPSIHKCWH